MSWQIDVETVQKFAELRKSGKPFVFNAKISSEMFKPIIEQDMLKNANEQMTPFFSDNCKR